LLVRIFSNIILNALQIGRKWKAGTVEVGAKKEGNWCLSVFNDNGDGIAEELRDKIFLPHFSTKTPVQDLALP